MKNRNGFTLIELLAILVIIGFIMIMIFPSIEKLTSNTSQKTYEAYEKMMIEYAEVTDFSGTYICLKDLSEKNDNGLSDIINKGYKGYVEKVSSGFKVVLSDKPDSTITSRCS